MKHIHAGMSDDAQYITLALLTAAVRKLKRHEYRPYATVIHVQV